MRLPLTLSALMSYNQHFHWAGRVTCSTKLLPSAVYLIITIEETRRIDVLLKRVCGTSITLENYKYYIFCVCNCSLCHPAVLSTVASLAVTYTFILSHKRGDFWIKHS
jgi:hypothetical protein